MRCKRLWQNTPKLYLKEEVKKEEKKVFEEDLNTLTLSDLKNRASQLADYALHENADSVLIGGAMYLMPFLIFELNKRNIDAYYSFSKRISKDVIQKDGRVKKTIIFKHCGFIRATLPKE